MSEIDDWTGMVHQGDAVETMREMPESSVNCVAFSPPYFGLRNYSVEGQIGQEDTLDKYIGNMVEVGKAVRHVLREDGCWWLNLGDSYATARNDHTGGDDVGGAPEGEYATRKEKSLGRKNKMLVPHRTAIALQKDGWVCRNDVVWSKPNPMPSSVQDRLNTTFEFLFHFVPNPDYYYDLDAIREPHAESSLERVKHGLEHQHPDDVGVGVSPVDTDEMGERFVHPEGKNPGDVFEITTKPFPDAHFAVYPPELMEKPIKATCPWKTCSECGSPYERIVEREVPEDPGRSEDSQYLQNDTRTEKDAHRQLGGNYQDMLESREVEMKGWQSQCNCETDETEPGVVLDPFMGSGTTAVVAEELDRRWVGIDLNPEYVDMSEDRISEETVRTEDYETPLKEW